MGCMLSNENCSSMYGYRFVYKEKDIKMYRYIVYEDVKFNNSIVYDEGIISKGILYPFVINDIHTGTFLFTDEYNNPLMSTSRVPTMIRDVPTIVDLFTDYFSTHKRSKCSCNDPTVKLLPFKG